MMKKDTLLNEMVREQEGLLVLAEHYRNGKVINATESDVKVCLMQIESRLKELSDKIHSFNK